MKLLFYRFSTAIEKFGLIALFVICLLAIIGIIAFFVSVSIKSNIVHKQKPTLRSILAIIVSSLLCSVMMIPLSACFSSWIKKTVEGEEYAKANREIENVRLKAENLKNQNQLLEQKIALEQKTIRQDELEKEIALLKNTQMSFQNFTKILEVALLETDLQKYDVQQWWADDSDAEIGWGIKADRYKDYFLVVQNHELNAKYGIDLDNIFVKEDGKSLYVYGITPKYIGSTKHTTDTIIAEKRRRMWKAETNIGDEILLSQKDTVEANQAQERVLNAFRERLALGEELGYLNEPVSKLGENFLKVIFSPIYGDRIFFSSEDVEDGIKLTDFFTVKLASAEDEQRILFEESEKKYQTAAVSYTESPNAGDISPME